MTNIDITTIGTYDLGLAAGLMAAGHVLVHIALEKGSSRGEFFFESSEELHIDMINYWKHELRVSAYSAFSSQKELKARVFNLKKTYEKSDAN